MNIVPTIRCNPQAGFTLLELLIVMALIATCTTLVTLSLPDPDRSRLERDAQRLAALLDSARAQSRSSGVTIWWQATQEGYRFLRQAAPQAQPISITSNRWLDPAVHIAGGPRVMQLGPEPIIRPYQLLLARGSQRLRLGSDGLHPFDIRHEVP